MLAAMAVGESRIEGLLEGEDVLATAGALRAMGVELERTGAGSWRVWGVGVGGLAEPADVLDLGNAGTGARLLMGLLAGHGFTSFLTGDASLRSRPMRRVIEPLGRMGASFLARSGGRLPLALTGRTDLLPIVYESPVASAQVKSAVLLAGPARAGRHHRGRAAGLARPYRADAGGHGGGGHGRGAAGRRPAGDHQGPAGAAAAELRRAGRPVLGRRSRPWPAACAAGSAVRLEGVGLNPLRTGLYTTLREMGADIAIEDERTGRRRAGRRSRRSAGGELHGVEVPAERAPAMIDEYPILAVAAAWRAGTTVMRGLAELRVKESDRLATMADGPGRLRRRGRGRGRRPDRPWRAAARRRRDHRRPARPPHRDELPGAGRPRGAPVTVEGAEAIETSFPGFAALMNGLGAEIAPAGAEA